jgi:hypothetical protein
MMRSIQDHLSSYTKLSKLTALSLADLSCLGLGFHPPRCGNAYRQPGVRERVQKDREEAWARLIDGVERFLLQGRAGRGTCVLKQLTVGRKEWDRQDFYVDGNDGKLKRAL